MATTASGVTIPGASPTTTAATPIQDHWNNLGRSLNGHIVVPVASVTARAALVTALTADGYTISASNPLYTHRADAAAGFQLEVTINGTTWSPIVSGDTGWVTPTLGNSWVSYDGGTTFQVPQYRVLAGVVYLAGFMKSGTSSAAFTLPVGSRPAKRLYFTVPVSTGNATAVVSANGDVTIVSYIAGGTNANVSLNGVQFIAEA